MAEFVLGTGQQKSIQKIVRMVEQQLRRIEGVPNRIHIWTDDIEILAARHAEADAFTSYRIILPSQNVEHTTLKKSIQTHQKTCALQEEGQTVTLTCSLAELTDSDARAAILEEISQSLTLPEVWRVKGSEYRTDRISIELLFQAMVQYRASDIHLSPGVPPVFRIDNETRRSEILAPLSAVQISQIIEEIAPHEFWEEFQQYKQTSFNFHQIGIGYARVSAFIKSGAPHCTLRFLPENIPSFDDLNVPPETMQQLANLHRGLLLVTGMTGSGKTTTVAALLDWINSHKSMHILTIENPIEYVHVNKKSVLSQRSLGSDVDSFNEAITGALRHDPDVILIGEMRDPDTIRAAINAAATGHLVVSTLHANTASEVVNRIVSFFDPIERDLVRLQLRDCLKCVICQRLVPRIGGGRLPALEMMFNDMKAISDGIIIGNSDLIRMGMQQTVSHSFVFERYLYNLYKQKKIDLEHARDYCTDQSMFDQLQMGTYSIPRLDSIKGQGEHAMFKA